MNNKQIKRMPVVMIDDKPTELFTAHNLLQRYLDDSCRAVYAKAFHLFLQCFQESLPW